MVSVSGVSPQPSFFSSLSTHLSHLNPLRLIFPQAPPEAQTSLHQRTITPVSLSHLTQLSQQDLNDNWNNLLKDVQQALIAQSGDRLDDATKSDLQKIFEHLSLDHLQQFLNHLPEWQLAKADIPLSDLALDAIPANKIVDIIKKLHPDQFTSIADYVAQLAKCLPPEPQEASLPQATTQTTRSTNVITNFLSNFGRLFIQSFDIFDTPRPPDTIYEYHVLTDIYFQFFKIPYVIVIALAQFIASPWNVLITTLVILGIAIATLYSYLRWFKPCPQQVWYCTTRDNLKIPSVFCHEQELKLALDFLGHGKQTSSRSIVFIGEPGVGKSQLMKALAASLNKKRVFDIDPTKLFGSSNVMMSVMEKITMAFKEVRGYENQVVFLLDEAGHAFKSKADDMLPLFKLLKDNYPGIQIIVTMNHDQWKKLIEQDSAIKDRFKPIEVKETNPDNTLRIIEDEAKKDYPHIPITRDGFQAIVEQTNKDKKGCQPRQALFALEELAKCADSLNQTKSEIDQAVHALANMKAEMERPNNPANVPFSNEFYNHQQNIANQEKLIKELQEKQEQNDQMKQQVRKGLDLDRTYLQQRNAAVRRLTQQTPLSEAEQALWQKRLMFTNFFAFKHMKHWLDERRKSLQDGIFPLIDKNYVIQKLAVTQK